LKIQQLEQRLAQKLRGGSPRGMTLIEILVVIAIIGIVATVVAVGVVGYLRDAKIETTKTLVDNVAKAVASYAVTHKGNLPSDLELLVKKQYVKKNQLKDPWDNELEYRGDSDGDIDSFTLCSAGPDGSSGTEDDICSNRDEDE
jgi:general secretion pathway protein G